MVSLFTRKVELLRPVVRPVIVDIDSLVLPLKSSPSSVAEQPVVSAELTSLFAAAGDETEPFNDTELKVVMSWLPVRTSNEFLFGLTKALLSTGLVDYTAIVSFCLHDFKVDGHVRFIEDTVSQDNHLLTGELFGLNRFVVDGPQFDLDYVLNKTLLTNWEAQMLLASVPMGPAAKSPYGKLRKPVASAARYQRFDDVMKDSYEFRKHNFLNLSAVTGAINIIPPA